MRQTSTNTPIREKNADLLGISCALLCLLHCWSLPAIALLAPTVELLNFFTSPIAHQCLFLVTLYAAIKAIGPELKQHRDPLIGTSLGLGLTILFTEAFLISAFGSPKAGVISATTPEGLAGQVQLAGSLVPFQGLSLPIAVSSNATMIALAQYVHPWLNPSGGCLLIAAHLFNLRKRQERSSSLKHIACSNHQHQ